MKHPVCMLKNIATVTSGQSAPQGMQYFSDHGTPFVRAGSLEFLTRGLSEDDCEKISERVAQKFHLRLLPADTILFAKSGMSAKIGRVYRFKSPCYVVSHLAAVIPGPKIVPSYLQRWFERFPPSRLIPNEAYPSIRLSEIERLQIPVPPLPEQKRIATILDKADAIRRKRQHAIKLADEFLRSVFLDMFGDPVINTKRWNKASLESLCSNVVDCPHATPIYEDQKSPYPCLRSSDLQNGHLAFQTTKYVDKNVYHDRTLRLKPTKGDIIYCREGARLGNCAIVPEELTPCLGQRTMLFRADQNEATPAFLITLLNHKGVRKDISNKIIGAAAPRVNIQDLKQYDIIRPPLSLQRHYEKVSFRFEWNRRRCLDHLKLSKEAFNSLVQIAFHGEL